MPDLTPNYDAYKESSAYLPYAKAQPKSVDRLPWWLQINALGTPQQGMQIFAPGVNAAIKAAAQPIPQGLSPQDMANMSARIAAQNQMATQNALASAGRQIGVANPAFAMSAARMKAGAGANTASQMANVSIQEKRNNQNLDMQRRSQMADAAKLGIGYGQNMMGWFGQQAQSDAAYNNYLLDLARYNAWRARTNSVLGSGITAWGGIPG